MSEKKKQDRPSKTDPRGVIYVISAEALYDSSRNLTRGLRHHTKIGLTRYPLIKGQGRQQTAEFWLEALGLGHLEIHSQFEHSDAFYLEKRIHAELKDDLNPDCGKSRESFNIEPNLAVTKVQKIIREFKRA